MADTALNDYFAKLIPVWQQIWLQQQGDGPHCPHGLQEVRSPELPTPVRTWEVEALGWWRIPDPI